MNAAPKKSPNKAAAPPRYGLSHCLECDRKIPNSGNYTFFCSKDCAADWGDDEAQVQFLRARAEQKKEN
jgi:hypothetical protein